MADIKLHFEIPDLEEHLRQFALEIEQDMEAGIKNLAAMTHAKVLEMANQELKSTKKKFAENLTWAELAPGVYAVTILAPAVWIDEGLPADFDMKPGLLAKPDGITKDGRRYRVIPMDQAKAPSNLAPQGKADLETLKDALKEKKIPLRKLERNSDGSIKTGKLHSFDIDSRTPGKGNTQLLSRVNIYQTANEKGQVSRQVTTFRTVVEGSEGWKHPGLEPHNFLDKAAQFAEQIWDTQILPEILRKWE